MPTMLSMRVSHYDGAAAQRLRDDLTHLEEAAGSPDAQVPWLAEHASEPHFRLVTASLDGRLVGYCAGVTRGDKVELLRLLTVPAASDHEPELSDALVDLLIEISELRHPKVSLDGDSRAMGHLVHVGWRPVADDEAPDGHVVLEHTGQRRHG